MDFKSGTLIDVALQNELENIYRFLINKKHPFIFTGGEFVSITAEARKNAIEMEERVLVGYNAIIVKNLAQRLIADYYYRFNKPKNPYKVFKKFEDGIRWLKEVSEEQRA